MKMILKNARDPISSLTHFIGLLAMTASLVLIVVKGYVVKTPGIRLFSAVVFAVSGMLLYFASSYYHYYKGPSDKIKWFRKLDHSMIFVLIAGSYTPMCVMSMSEEKAIRFCLLVWGVALLGIIFKLFFINAPRWITTIFYLLMGWMVLLDWNSFSSLPSGCLLLVALGGISYSVGAIIYGMRWPTINKDWSFHEIFHVFIMIGTFLHFLAVYFYIL